MKSVWKDTNIIRDDKGNLTVEKECVEKIKLKLEVFGYPMSGNGTSRLYYSKNHTELLNEYKSLLDLKDEYYGSDLKGNLKFVEYAIRQIYKTNKSDPNSEACWFIEQTIELHKKNYM